MTTTMVRQVDRHDVSDDTTYADTRRQKAGGVAALYLALALVAAIPYFLLVVDYPGASTATDKVELILDNFASMYAMHLATYVVFGIALSALALALRDRLHTQAPATVRTATGIGLLWSFALVASGLVFTQGMTAIDALSATGRAQAVTAWQAIEPVADGLGGAGGEILGGLWVLLVSLVALRGRALPRALGWLGVVVGVVGLVSVVPALRDATVAFGMLEIVWLAWIGIVLIATRAPAVADGPSGSTASTDGALVGS